MLLARTAVAAKSQMFAELETEMPMLMPMQTQLQMQDQRNCSFRRRIDIPLRNIHPSFLRRFSERFLTAGAEKEDLPHHPAAEQQLPPSGLLGLQK